MSKIKYSNTAFSDVIKADHTVTALAAGHTAMKKFAPHISTTIQADRIFDHLVTEATTAARAIDKKFMSVSFLAGAGPVPGNPVGALQVAGGAGVGFYQLYQNGAIYWRQNVGAHWIHGAIYQKYLQLKGEDGLLGFPVSDELTAMDTVGRFSNFEKGSIYWHPLSGAFEIHGQVKAKWLAAGGTNLGYPITDEKASPDGVFAYNDFRDFVHGGNDASVYWSIGTGGCLLRGPIRARWLELGGFTSYLGWPAGSIEGWTDPLSFHSDGIGVSAIGGWAEIIVSSSGVYKYKGHLHNSGAIGMAVTVSSAVPIPGTEIVLMTIPQKMNIGGTASFDDRDEDWDVQGYSNEVRVLWANIRNAHTMSTEVSAGPGPFEYFLFVFIGIFAAATAIALAFGGKGSDTTCEWGMHGPYETNNGDLMHSRSYRCEKP